MKFFFALSLLLAASLGGARAEFLNGVDYSPLSQWARGNGFGGYTLDRGDKIVLTNRTTRMVFDVNAQDVEINGVEVRLAYPVAKIRERPHVAQLDLDKSIRPLVFPQKASAKKVTTICIDPGHGGKDTGFRIGRFLIRNEKTYTLALALELRAQLQKAGYNVILTRDRDVYPELTVRPEIANKRGADLFIALHFNAFPGDPNRVQGVETYCMTPAGAPSSNDATRAGAGSRAYPANRVDEKSLLLSYQIHRSLVRGLGATDRSVRRARFEVIRTAEMPTAYIEGGYMSHPTEGKKIFDPAYRKQMAAAIVRGIQAYQKLTDPPPAKPVPVKPKPATTKPMPTTTR